MQFVRKHGVVGMVFWACSSKRGEFRRFTGTVRVSIGFSRVGRVSSLSKVMAGIRVSVRIMVILVLMIA